MRQTIAIKLIQADCYMFLETDFLKLLAKLLHKCGILENYDPYYRSELQITKCFHIHSLNSHYYPMNSIFGTSLDEENGKWSLKTKATLQWLSLKSTVVLHSRLKDTQLHEIDLWRKKALDYALFILSPITHRMSSLHFGVGRGFVPLSTLLLLLLWPAHQTCFNET